MTDKKYDVSVSQASGMASKGNQEQAVNIGDHYHGLTYKKLKEVHDSHIVFDPHSLKEIIVTIDDGIESVDCEPIDYSIGIDIDKKNELNNHSKSYFEDFVELDFYPQFYKIDNFLGLKENQKSLQSKVDRVIKSLNRQIYVYQGNEPFESVLLKITTKLIDEKHDVLGGKEHEVLLILYYFYCNCCIGKKTDEEKKC